MAKRQTEDGPPQACSCTHCRSIRFRARAPRPVKQLKSLKGQRSLFEVDSTVRLRSTPNVNVTGQLAAD